MEIADPVSSILEHKDLGDIYCIASADTVYDAITRMAQKNIGAILVIDDDKLVGIMSERDYTRKVILEGRASRDTPVSDIMSSPVIVVPPDAQAGACLQLMTEKHIRHLPVVDRNDHTRVLGVISIGDLVKRTISAQQALIGQLESYLTGGYPG